MTQHVTWQLTDIIRYQGQAYPETIRNCPSLRMTGANWYQDGYNLLSGLQ